MSLDDKSITYASNFIATSLKEPMTFKNFTNTILVSNESKDDFYRTTVGDFFLDHWADLAPTMEYFSLPQDYFYQPKKLSLQLYGTADLWLALLRINGMRNITEFHNTIIRIYNPGRLQELINIFFKRQQK